MAVGAQYFARQNTYMVDVFLFVVLTSVRPALPKSGEISAMFLDRGFLTQTVPNKGTGAPGFGGALAMSMSCCMCEPM